MPTRSTWSTCRSAASAATRQPDAQASNTLVASGVVVVASAGNEGPNAFMTGSPGNATGVLSVAASDTIPELPGRDDRPRDRRRPQRHQPERLARPAGRRHPGGDQDNPARRPRWARVTSTWAATRPTTARCRRTRSPSSSAASARSSTRARRPRQAGAIGVIVINRDDIADPLELPDLHRLHAVDLRHPDDRHRARRQADPPAAPTASAATLKSGPSITNGAYLNNADFSSGGPRLGDNAQKPDVSAPGVNITSTAVGLGYKGDTLSGTSMASPHVAGVAALVHARHPTWKPEQIKAAIVGTGDPVEGQPVRRPHRGLGHGPASSRSRHGRLRAGDGPDAEPLVRLRPGPPGPVPRDQVVHDLQHEQQGHHLQADGRQHRPPQQDRGDGQGA